MSNLKRFRGSFAIIFGLMLAALMLWGQVETGQISGTVQDATGAVVPNVTVTAKSVTTGTMRSTVTNTAGVYVLPNLSPGDWEVTLSASGFSTQKRRVTVDVGSKVTMDAKMEVGQTSTTVEVNAGAVQVNTESQTVSNTINTQQVTELPSLTRNPYDFVATVPNVTSDMQSGRGVGYAVNGMRSSSTNVMLDGVANNDDFTATVGQQVPLDSVQEYQVVTSDFSAEYGRASGGVVNVMTKSGSNDFHGSAYEFNRVSALASNGYFNNANDLPKGIYDPQQLRLRDWRADQEEQAVLLPEHGVDSHSQLCQRSSECSDAAVDCRIQCQHAGVLQRLWQIAQRPVHPCHFHQGGHPQHLHRRLGNGPVRRAARQHADVQ